MSESYLPKLLNALHEAVFILDADRAVRSANPMAEKMFGQGYIGQDFVKVSRNPDIIGAIGQILTGQGSDIQIVTVDAIANTSFQVNVASLGTDNPDGACLIVCIKDISDMREAEQMRSDFVANVSHELRSPLTSLSGFIETLAEMGDEDSKARQRFLNLMGLEAQRMIRLIADLLSLSKVESRQRMRPEGQADIVAILKRVRATLEDLAEKEGKTFNLELPDHVPKIPGSEDELTQVFQNLMENAAKYGRRDTIVGVRMEERPRAPGIQGPAIVVHISDEGEGIAQHHIPRLTERFYRVDTHRSRNKGGTGLGLAIVKHIINRHRGRLLISSTEGAGSTFTVNLPMTYQNR